jgi:hypothetical protein
VKKLDELQAVLVTKVKEHEEKKKDERLSFSSLFSKEDWGFLTSHDNYRFIMNILNADVTDPKLLRMFFFRFPFDSRWFLIFCSFFSPFFS